MSSMFSHSAQSNQTNKSRLQVLQTREQHLQDLFDGAKEKLKELSGDEGKYSELLKGLILQVGSRSIVSQLAAKYWEPFTSF